MGIVRHPNGVRPTTLFNLRAPSMRGDANMYLDSAETIVFGTVLQRNKKVSFDDDAMMQFHYRECHPSFMSSRAYWGTYRPPVPVVLFPHPDVVKIAEQQAIEDAHSLYVEVYGEKAEKENKNTISKESKQSSGPSSSSARGLSSSSAVLTVG